MKSQRALCVPLLPPPFGASRAGILPAFDGEYGEIHTRESKASGAPALYYGLKAEDQAEVIPGGKSFSGAEPRKGKAER